MITVIIPVGVIKRKRERTSAPGYWRTTGRTTRFPRKGRNVLQRAGIVDS